MPASPWCHRAEKSLFVWLEQQHVTGWDKGLELFIPVFLSSGPRLRDRHIRSRVISVSL